MNTKKQDRLVVELNRHFTETDDKDGFATAVVATYLSHKSTLLLTNAGHPRPLFCRQSQDHWEFLDLPTTDKGLGDNFPFGLDQSTRYEHFVIKIEPGDWLLLYTDAYTESCDQGQDVGRKRVARSRSADTSLFHGIAVWQRVEPADERTLQAMAER